MAISATSTTDTLSSILIGNLSKHPKAYDSIGAKLRDRVGRCVDRFLSLFSSVGTLDTTLKLVDAGLKVTKHVDEEAYEPAAKAHGVVKDLRGVFGVFKVPGGLWKFGGNVTNLHQLLTNEPSPKKPIMIGAKGIRPGYTESKKYGNRITTVFQRQLAILYESLSAIGNLLYTAAFASKSFSYINSKYQAMKGGMLEFSKMFPKIFFGLHLVAVPKTVTAIFLESSTFATSTEFAIDPNEGNLSTLNKRRNAEIVHSRNQTCHALDLIKLGFEFVRDGVMLSKTGSLVIDLVGVAGVAIFDFMGAWLKSM